ncbi:hypothetical protein BHM03_00017319 [Ensete ventricosum]|nr:hypothetical protein BHM03_00017319 [Ensete ventricosum]
MSKKRSFRYPELPKTKQIWLIFLPLIAHFYYILEQLANFTQQELSEFDKGRYKVESMVGLFHSESFKPKNPLQCRLLGASVKQLGVPPSQSKQSGDLLQLLHHSISLYLTLLALKREAEV